ncbi:male sterility protein-domain-containing protein [Polychytrium aggregatum]|uniref:male sterility protein-domain-containing protein n=1 Tax=Polychytrium aggregatum TaxID=110093 RepID=UPI0022FF43A9|nr:male sterility protein-domain-containing protein [Polychytrium aggregatum]KAI9199474.1 male sterility protein-domain-containing protein [Polychytrium aggregatum]
MVFKELLCCFADQDDTPPHDRGIVKSAQHAAESALPSGPDHAQESAPTAAAEVSEPVQSEPRPVPPMDPFDAWMHPIEALIKMVRQEPSALAIFTSENDTIERYSYLRLWERAYSIAQGLKTLPGWDDEGHSVVAIYCEPEAHWVLYSFAAWILGKKVINFALNWSASVRNEISKRLGIRYILFRFTHPGRIQGVEQVDASLFPPVKDIPEASLEVCAPLSEQIFYMSTSGTTGVPKTYLGAHKSGAPLRRNLCITYGRIGFFLAPSFSASMLLMLGTLQAKASIWFPKPTNNHVDKAQNIIRLLDEGMDILRGTPSLINLVFKLALAKNRNTQWPGVKRVSPGAELVSIHLIQQARNFCPNATMQCSYGSSEAVLIQAFGFSIIRPKDPIPERLVYTISNPGVRCLLFDENGDTVDTTKTRNGILVYAVSPDHPIRSHPNFANSNPNEKLAAFGFLEDGSPRVCTMDEVELVSEREIVIFGRYGQKIKINGVYIDLHVLETLLSTSISQMVSDCAFVQTSDQKIVLLYVLKKDYPVALTSRQILDAAETIFTLQNISRVPIHNCLELLAMPFNDSGKRDTKKLKRIAENADHHELAMAYPALVVDDTPLSKAALKVSRIGSQLLDIEVLDGRDYYIAGVGFDSLSVGRLTLAIKEEFDVEISPLILLSHGMTAKNIASIIVDLGDGRPFQPPTVDLAQEAAKHDDATVTAEGLPAFVFPEAPKTILLTGATGFLGIFLLFELAARFPEAKIVCLVRAKDKHAAKERLKTTAATIVVDSRDSTAPKYDIWGRVEALPGDLSHDKWGLSEAVWDALGQSVDVIVHNGAEVHWLQDYHALKGPNVLGTATALRLATAHHLKPLHYISSVGTVPKTKGSAAPLEETLYSAWDISGGYGQTKWVSEQLVNKARSRGVPATIIRPAVIAGDSRYGVCNSDDYIWRYVKGCIQLGIAPCHVSTVTTSMDPVDHVAKVITEIAASETALSKFVFHISHPENSAISEREIFEAVKGMGWDTKFETRDQFRAALVESHSQHQNALFPLMHMVMSMSFRMDNANTRSIYPAPGLPAASQVANCLQYLCQAGYLPEIPSSPRLPEEQFPRVSIVSRTGRH